MTDLPKFEIERDISAPRALVWRAWTDPQLVARWYGPGVETIIHEFDLRPGGVWQNEMRMSKGSDYSRMAFTEVVEPERLVWLHSSADSDWNVTANAMMPDWPRTLLTTVTFADRGAGTRVRLTWVPHEASEAEFACFKGAMDGFGKGWGAGFDIIETILAELQAG